MVWRSNRSRGEGSGITSSRVLPIFSDAPTAGTLAAAMQAVGGRVPLLATVTVFAALRLLWSLAPATGAPGAQPGGIHGDGA